VDVPGDAGKEEKKKGMIGGRHGRSSVHLSLGGEQRQVRGGGGDDRGVLTNGEVWSQGTHQKGKDHVSGFCEEIGGKGGKRGILGGSGSLDSEEARRGAPPCFGGGGKQDAGPFWGGEASIML